ncbi:LOW QUALITY PROTEIN: 26S proteasome non-ATPase regulatory subunit 3 [Populus alba x Populus x berolinensis]|nr:LOW QUALITY PROTEIN: 26S proteasome non-ATPase regulatory subunit 3 [Populus alba x Populus x berolinensis]
MSQDSEINSNSTASSYTSAFISTYESLIKIVSHIELSSDVRRTARANSELNARLSSFLIIEEDEETDSAMSVCAIEFSLELEFYCYFLVLIFLIDQKRYNEVILDSGDVFLGPKACSLDGITRVMSLNMAELDSVSVLAARLYFYYSYSYEVSGDIAEIRWNLLDWYSVAALNHDELGQETLLNLLLRNYLHYNLYDQAGKLRSKAPKFLSLSCQQTRRYLFYTGKIQTIRLANTDAKESFCKLFGEVQLQLVAFEFNSGMERILRPYFELTNAVRIGDLELFGNVAEEFAGTFISDGTKNLIVRLQHSVIRTGLRSISISYSSISLAEVADKLKMHSRNLLADVENQRPSADGAINAKIDHANGWLISKETRDIYATAEPQVYCDNR